MLGERQHRVSEELLECGRVVRRADRDAALRAGDRIPWLARRQLAARQPVVRPFLLEPRAGQYASMRARLRPPRSSLRFPRDCGPAFPRASRRGCCRPRRARGSPGTRAQDRRVRARAPRRRRRSPSRTPSGPPTWPRPRRGRQCDRRAPARRAPRCRRLQNAASQRRARARRRGSRCRRTRVARAATAAARPRARTPRGVRRTRGRRAARNAECVPVR